MKMNPWIKHMRGDRREVVQSVIDAANLSRDGIAVGRSGSFQCLADGEGWWYPPWLLGKDRGEGNLWRWREMKLPIVRNFTEHITWEPHDPYSPLELLAMESES